MTATRARRGATSFSSPNHLPPISGSTELESAENAGAWPAVFQDSRRWCFLTLRPGPEPVRSLVERFLDTWQLDRTSTEWPERRAEWVNKLLDGKLTLPPG